MGEQMGLRFRERGTPPRVSPFDLAPAHNRRESPERTVCQVSLDASGGMAVRFDCGHGIVTALAHRDYYQVNFIVTCRECKEEMAHAA